MMDVPLTEVNRLVAAANAVRWGDVASPEDAAAAERELDALFRTRQTLAVYGTLAPGQPNHHIVAPLGGEWTEGVVEGDLHPVGWGATLGYRAFRPRAGGLAPARSLRRTGVSAHPGTGIHPRPAGRAAAPHRRQPLRRRRARARRDRALT
jgi:hypothetical protein